MVKRSTPKDVFKHLHLKEQIEYAKIDKTPRTSEKLMKTMREACGMLDELGVTYWVSRGTLLGIHRERSFLPNELDIDIDVYSDKDVYRIIRKLPYDVVMTSFSEGHYMQIAFLDRETDVIFDVWFYYSYKEQLINRNCFGYFMLPGNMVESLKSISFNNNYFPTVSDPEWYCRYWYGENWRTPKKYGKDWQYDYERDCGAFIFLGEKELSYKKYY